MLTHGYVNYGRFTAFSFGCFIIQKFKWHKGKIPTTADPLQAHDSEKKMISQKEEGSWESHGRQEHFWVLNMILLRALFVLSSKAMAP